MGAYLSTPVTEKQSECGGNDRARYAATTMQGWRINQEDAHNCIADFDEHCSFFAVYDGHGGSEVAQYTAQHLPDVLKANSFWYSGDFRKAIEDTFLKFDEQLRSDTVLKELKKMAGTVAPKPEEQVDDDDDRQLLCEEAKTPLETILMQKYGVFLHRDRNGKQSLIDLEELRAQIEKQTEAEEEVEGKCEANEKINKNGSENGMEQESNGKEQQNGNVMDVKEEEQKAGDSGTRPTDKKPSDEKSKKRVCDSSPSSLSAKRTKSSEDSEEVRSEDRSVNSSVSNSGAAPVDDTTETVVKDERCEATTGDDEAPNSEPEVAGPADVASSIAATASKNSSAIAGDCSQPSSENPTPQLPATSPDAQNAFSSDSEQSMDEDYNVEEEEMSEGEVDEDEDESEGDDAEPAYCGPTGDTPGEDSGTTACVTILFKDKVIVGNVGDSRAVLSRKGTAVELSVDHKPEDETERRRIVAAGGSISPDGRVNGGLNLSRALGDHYYKKNDLLPLKEQMISAQPDVKEYKITDDDEFIIVACDGIWNSLTSQEAVDFVRQRINDNVDLKDICEQICDHCLSPSTAGDGTGCDNMTVIVAQILRTTPMPPQLEQQQH